jgi:hypothetical protein
MRRFLPIIVAVVGVGAMLWILTNLNNGPDVTGPDGAEIVVPDVPSPDRSEDDIWALPDGFHQLLERDAIAPIYSPVFTSAADST